MKRLSLRAASRCEHAKSKRCECRCGGRLHGAARAKDGDAEFYASLPKDDPHHALAKPMRKKFRSLPLFDSDDQVSA